MISSLSHYYIAHLRNPHKVRLDVVGMCADGRGGGVVHPQRHIIAHFPPTEWLLDKEVGLGLESPR
jgi:hypothetical protein